jgi:hypothetical protein
MPRAVPWLSVIAPLRAKARRCISAALGELKPNTEAISARVGGMPVSSMRLRISARISAWRAVREESMGGMASALDTVYLYSIRSKCKWREGGR